MLVIFLITRQPLRSPLFPYTTLFRSLRGRRARRSLAACGVRGTAAAGVSGDGGEHPLRRLPRRSEEHTSELQSRRELVCRLLLEKKKNHQDNSSSILQHTFDIIITRI